MALVNDPKSSWQELYLAALLEPDQNKLTKLVLAVEDAMFHRAQELANSYADNQERTEMDLSLIHILNSSRKSSNLPCCCRLFPPAGRVVCVLSVRCMRSRCV